MQKKIGVQKKMQHGETGAALPRAVARQRGRETCQVHNGRPAAWINRYTGKSLDRTGTFEVERRATKKKQALPPQD